jgi:hypothetical protein
MADLNNQIKITPELQNEVTQLLQKRVKEKTHGKLLQTTGKIMSGAGALSRNLGKRLGSEKLAQAGSKVAGLGKEAQAIGSKTQDTGYIKKAVNRRDSARTGEEPLEPGAPIGIVGSPLPYTDQEAAADYLQKQRNKAGQGAKDNAVEKNEPNKEDASKALTGANEQTTAKVGPENQTDIKNIYDRVTSKARKEGVGAGIQELRSQAVSMGGKILTGKILNYCWLDVGDFFASTLGLSLIYINFHFICKYIAYWDAFCEFGEEWTLKGSTGGVAEQLTGQDENPVEKTTSSALKYAEIIGMFLMDVLVLIIIVTLFYAAYYVLGSWYDLAKLYLTS